MEKTWKHEIKFGIDSILDTAATPQRLKQWGVKDYRSGNTLSQSASFAFAQIPHCIGISEEDY
jgi:hypothetical protein